MWSPEERLNLLRAETERLEQYLQGLPEEAWQRSSACDRWTVADVVAHLTGSGRVYPLIVERIPQRPRWSFRAEAGFAPLLLRYRFAVSPPAPSIVDVVVTEKQQYLEVGSTEGAQVTMRCDGATFVLLMYGRIKPEAAIAEGRVSVEGDKQLVTDFGSLTIFGL